MTYLYLAAPCLVVLYLYARVFLWLWGANEQPDGKLGNGRRMYGQKGVRKGETALEAIARHMSEVAEEGCAPHENRVIMGYIVWELNAPHEGYNKQECETWGEALAHVGNFVEYAAETWEPGLRAEHERWLRGEIPSIKAHRLEIFITGGRMACVTPGEGC